MRPLEETLTYALRDFGLRQLPPEWYPNGDTTLVNGIALVLKAGGIREYCKVANDKGKISVVRDYGRCAAIIKIEKIFAVNTITGANIPKFKNDEEIVAYLCKSRFSRPEIERLLSTEGKSQEQIERDRTQINAYINELAIGFEIRKKAEEKRVDEIKEFAETAKKERKANGRKKKKD